MRKKNYLKPSMLTVMIHPGNGLLVGSGEQEKKVDAELEDYNRSSADDW